MRTQVHLCLRTPHRTAALLPWPPRRCAGTLARPLREELLGTLGPIGDRCGRGALLRTLALLLERASCTPSVLSAAPFQGPWRQVGKVSALP